MDENSSAQIARQFVAAAANANTVTVKFNGSANFADIRIAEYGGIDQVNPLDVSAGVQGNGATASSGTITTTNANDLLVGADIVQTGTSGAGSGYTTRIITNPDSDILEDTIVSTIGSYSATAPVSPSAPWIMQMVAFKAAGSVPTPTAPSNLAATAAGPVQINLSWTAATEIGGSIANYLIERCSGASCSSFAQVGTSTGTTYNDTGLIGSTNYSYRVRARDAANVTGPYSNTATATTAAPTFTAPSNLAATAAGPVQINLSWTAATESGGTITNYLIERCSGACSSFTQVGTSATTTFSNTGLLGSTAYTYRVRATDGTNFSGYSSSASATTAAPTFTAPSNLTATAASNTQINLSWTAATESGGTITNYLIERCQGAGCSNFTQVATSATTTSNDTGLLAGTTYSYRVRATDAASNLGPYSNVASAATTAAPPPAIAFVQGNYATPQTPQSTVAVTFTLAQGAGNLNVIIIGWNDSTATLSSVTDTKANNYVPVAPALVLAGTASQAIYYAKNIGSATAGSNIVTVKFNVAAAYPDIRILEYSGIDITNPLDVTAAASGNSASASSGAVTTTNANDLIIGANLVQTGTPGPGSGFTSRIITVPDSDIAEDMIVAATGSYAATSPVSPAAPWIMHMVAFKRHP